MPPAGFPLDFEQLFDASPNPYMVLDAELRYVAMNEAYLAVTDSEREALLGQNIFDMFPGSPDDPADVNARMLRASFEKVLRTGERDELAIIPYTIPVRRGDEVVYEEHFWSATHTPIRNAAGEVAYILQHTVNVTEMLQTRKALRVAESALAEQAEAGVLRRAQAVQETNRVLGAEHERLRRLFEQAPGLIAILRGPDHVFDLANEAYYDVVGRRSLLGLPVREALPEVVGQGFVQLLDKVYTSGQPFVGRAVEVQLQRHAHEPLETRYVDFLYQPILEPDGTASGIFVEGHDVTEQVEAQRHLRELNASLEARVAHRTAELELRNRELQEFARVASHDLQEPLRKIQSFADLLLLEKSAQFDDEARDFTQRMQAAASRMSRLIRDLLSFSRVSTRGGSFEPVDLDAVLAGVLGDLDLRLHETEGRVEAEPLGIVVADPLQMQQMLLNLVGNGLKFHREGVPPVVRLRRETHDEHLRLFVSDNGIGIAEAHLSRIFSPFQRLHGRGRYEGTGMGLAIVRRIAERHHGHVAVHSVEGEGTTFTITLPLDPVEADAPAEPALETE